MKKFDYITVTNAYESNLLQSKYQMKSVSIITNGIEIEKYKELSNIVTVKNKITNIIYAGNVGLAQDLKIFIDAALELPDINFFIVGSGSEKDKLSQYVTKTKASNVILIGRIPWEELRQYYAQSSVLYCQLNEKYITAMPSKLYEYASIGLPIILGGCGQSKSFVGSLENSVAIKPNDVQQLVSAISSMKEIYGTISRKNRELIHKKYLREDSAKKFSCVIGRLIN